MTKFNEYLEAARKNDTDYDKKLREKWTKSDRLARKYGNKPLDSKSDEDKIEKILADKGIKVSVSYSVETGDIQIEGDEGQLQEIKSALKGTPYAGAIIDFV